MSKKDTSEKAYLSDNKKFADVANYVLFNGVQRIHANDLSGEDTTEVFEDIIKNINESAQYLKYAILEDNTKWDTFLPYKSSGADTWILYQGQVSSMKSWLTERMRWLREQFDAM